jgi:hypothetical protein
VDVTQEDLDEARAAIMTLLAHPQREQPGNLEQAQVLALIYVGDCIREQTDTSYSIAKGEAGL